MVRVVMTVKFTIGTLRCHDSYDNDNVKKVNRLNRQNNNSTRSSRFMYNTLPSLHDYDGKMPNFKFYGGRKQATTKFSFSF